MTIEELVANFKEYLINKGYKPNTFNGKIKKLSHFVAWTGKENLDPVEVNYNELLSFIQHEKRKGIRKATINEKLSTLKQFYNYLQEESLRKENPAAELRIRNITKKVPHDLLEFKELERIYESYPSSGIPGKRNKVILGLVIYQGLTSAEITALETTDLKLEEGKIWVPATNRSQSRLLKLEAFQVLQLQKYIAQIRPMLLEISEKESEKLFISTGKGSRLANSLQKLIKLVKKLNPKVKNIKQIRASVITHWIKNYHMRQVQYMTGHRYLSSTEHYRTDKLESLQEQIENLHPLKD